MLQSASGGVCSGGVPGRGVCVCVCSGGGVSALGGCLVGDGVWSSGVHGSGGCLVPGGMSGPGGGYPSMH